MRKLSLCLLITLALGSAATAQSQATRLEGQVVCCADCWAKADRTKVEYGTAEDLLRAKGCVEGGDPTLLAVREGDNFTLYQLEQGRFRLSGKNWLEYVGIAYGTYEDRARIIGGLNINFSERWSSTILFDGVRVHPLVNYNYGRHQFGVIFERGRNPGASYSISF